MKHTCNQSLFVSGCTSTYQSSHEKLLLLYTCISECHQTGKSFYSCHIQGVSLKFCFCYGPYTCIIAIFDEYIDVLGEKTMQMTNIKPSTKFCGSVELMSLAVVDGHCLIPYYSASLELQL